MANEIRVIGVQGIAEARPGDDLVDLIAAGLEHDAVHLEAGDIVVVTQKLVSKAEGQLVDLRTVEPSDFARRFAERAEKDARQIEVVLREAKRIVRMDRGLIIAETQHGFVCANAAVDASNVARDVVSLLPVDPDASARQICQGLRQRYGVNVAAIITDSFGRPWRRGIVNIAVGVAGMQPLRDYRGQTDDAGYEMHATVIAVADEVASAAELVMGKLDRCPVAIVRGYTWDPGDEGGAGLIMDSARDLFR